MHVRVEEGRCEGHGLCAETAPDVFDLDDDAFVVVRVPGELPTHLLGAAEAGARACPVAALRIVSS